LLTQSDGEIFLLTLNADDDGSNSKACLYPYNNSPKPSLGPKIGEIALPVTDMSDTVTFAGEKILSFPLPLIAAYAALGKSRLNSSFRWGKGVAITSSNSIELYASDRNVWPLSSIPDGNGSNKDFSVLVWQSSPFIPAGGIVVFRQGRMGVATTLD
jgi:hypothetical protein